MTIKGFLDDLGRLLTVKTILAFVLSSGVFVVIALWLASLTTFVSVFAPLSYLLVAAAAILLALLLFSAVLGIARQLGWRPRRREPKPPKRDASLQDVVRYIVRESVYGLQTFSGDVTAADVTKLEKEMMDRIGENELAVWGRIGHMQTSLIDPYNWQYCNLSLAQSKVTRAGDWGSSEYRDIQLNWKQVRRTWPRPAIWRRGLPFEISRVKRDNTPAA